MYRLHFCERGESLGGECLESLLLVDEDIVGVGWVGLRPWCVNVIVGDGENGFVLPGWGVLGLFPSRVG